MALLAANFDTVGMLPPGQDSRWASAVLYALIGPETWHLMRVELGQDPDDYRDWLHFTLTQIFRTAPLVDE